MKTLEEQAKEYLEDTKSLRIPDKHKELVKLLKRIRLDQDRDTRHACADSLGKAAEMFTICGICRFMINVEKAQNACLNAKAL